MRSSFRSFVASLTAAALLGASTLAAAQEPPPPAPSAPSAPPPPSSARAANGEYVAPLYQQTQPVYVPQSIALSGPAEFTYEEGQPIPDGYHLATRTRRGPIVAGAVTFGTLYLFSAIAAAGSGDAHQGGTNPEGALYIPGIGPFIQLGSTTTQTGTVVLVADGLGQSLGLALLIYGIANPKNVLVRNDLGKPMITPMRMGKDGYGLGLTGSF